MIRIIGPAEVAAALDYPSLVERLRTAFREGCEAPPRQQHTLAGEGEAAATLLIMPAWQEGHQIGVKLLTVFPSNAQKGLPTLTGVFLLFDATDGSPLAVIDGAALTRRRTAAASALAADYLAREGARRLVMVGTGALAPELVEAHAAVRPIRDVRIWGRNVTKAKRLAERLERAELRVAATADLEGAVRQADVVSCATMATKPLVRGEWLSPGAHLDLVGAFKPTMREADDEAVRRARLFVDTREGALQEAGDIVDPLRRGVIDADDIVADLFELARGTAAGREGETEITLFKSTGTALEDLAAARLLLARAYSGGRERGLSGASTRRSR